MSRDYTHMEKLMKNYLPFPNYIDHFIHDRWSPNEVPIFKLIYHNYSPSEWFLPVIMKSLTICSDINEAYHNTDYSYQYSHRHMLDFVSLDLP